MMSVKDQIAYAFVDLLIEKPFASISISEIVEKANVARVSFYRNYSNTREIIDYIIDNIIFEIKDMITPVIENSNERNWRDFLFRYVYFLTSSEKKYLLAKSENVILLLNIFVEEIHRLFPNNAGLGTYKKYDYISKVSMVNGVIIGWKQSGMKENIEELVNYLASRILCF